MKKVDKKVSSEKVALALIYSIGAYRKKLQKMPSKALSPNLIRRLKRMEVMDLLKEEDESK